MRFNLDLVRDELADLSPVALFDHSTHLDLDRIELLEKASGPRAGSLFIAEAETLAQVDLEAFDKGALLILGPDLPDTHALPLPAVLVPDPSRTLQASALLARLLEFRMRLDAWSESLLEAMARDASLQEVMDVAATAFRNPLMVSDSALYYVLCAGHLPNDFHDELWTTAIETGVCPTELYFDLWMSSSENAFHCDRAYFVENAPRTGHSYLVRNLLHDGAYHGCFELVDANAPFTQSDLVLADHLGRLLVLILPRQIYPQLDKSSKNPIDELLAGNAVRGRVLAYELSKFGWSVDDPYYVCRFSGSARSERSEGPHRQTLRRIERRYPRARFLEAEDDAYLMVAREKDYPLDEMRERLEEPAADDGLPARFLAGFSSVFSDFHFLRTAAQQASFALNLVEDDPSTGRNLRTVTRFYDDCWFDDLSDRLNLTGDARWLLDDRVVQLARIDAREDTRYVETARAYLESGCSATHAAEALFVHRNTLSYRLKRMRALSGMDLEDPSTAGTDLLRILLSCRIVA
ncbi:MAG: hypothetical protein PEGG_00006 [Paraeggerthella hongkongensis]